MYDQEVIQLPVKLNSWSINETDDAILEVFVSEEYSNRFASKIHWKESFSRFLANLTIDAGVTVANAVCVTCHYENGKVAWINGNDGPNSLHLTFLVDGRIWKLLLQTYPLLKNSESKKAKA